MKILIKHTHKIKFKITLLAFKSCLSIIKISLDTPANLKVIDKHSHTYFLAICEIPENLHLIQRFDGLSTVNLI